MFSSQYIVANNVESLQDSKSTYILPTKVNIYARERERERERKKTTSDYPPLNHLVVVRGTLTENEAKYLVEVST